MGLTFIQVSTEVVASAVTSVGQSYTTNTTLGSLLFAHCLAATGGSTYSVTDSLLNTWTRIGNFSAGGNSSAVFFAVNASSGANTVTFHSTASDTLTIFLAEYTGQATGATPIDVSFGETTWSETGTGTVNFGAITTTRTNETLIMFGRSSAGGAQLVTQDGSTVRSGNNSTVMLQDRNVATAGNYASAFSTTLSGNQGQGTFFSVKTPTSALPTQIAWLNKQRSLINKR